MKAIYLKLPHEKQNEAGSTVRESQISARLDGFPMWVSSTRASGCLQSYMIYIWLRAETPNTLPRARAHKKTAKETVGLSTEDYQRPAHPDKNNNRYSAAPWWSLTPPSPLREGPRGTSQSACPCLAPPAPAAVIPTQHASRRGCRSSQGSVTRFWHPERR